MKRSRLPSITIRQRELIVYVYKYRYLTHGQLKQFLKIKNTAALDRWLADLQTKQYIYGLEVPSFDQKSVGVIYCIGKNGLSFARNRYRTIAEQSIDPLLRMDINKRGMDSKRTNTFMRSCVLLADCVLAFLNTEARSVDATVTITSKADYICPDNPFNFLVDSIIMSQLGPQYCIESVDKNREPTTFKTYLLEVMSGTLPRYRIRARIDRYCRYLQEGSWEWEREGPQPIVLLICPNTEILKYARNRAKTKLKMLWPDERNRIHIKFATRTDITTSGPLTPIWSEA